MKKSTFLAAVLIATGTLFPSCKKQYTCSCDVVTAVTLHDFYEEDGQQKEDIEHYPLITGSESARTGKVKKNDAASACENKSTETHSQVNSTVTYGGFKEGIIQKTTRTSTCRLQ